jgi:hypothetical protein
MKMARSILVFIVLALVLASIASASHYRGLHWIRGDGQAEINPPVWNHSWDWPNRAEREQVPYYAGMWNQIGKIEAPHYYSSQDHTMCQGAWWVSGFPYYNQRFCNGHFGQTGWQGYSECVVISGDPQHLYGCVAVMNGSRYGVSGCTWGVGSEQCTISQTTINNVICHELGHNYGLAHYLSSYSYRYQYSCMNTVGFEPGWFENHDVQFIHWSIYGEDDVPGHTTPPPQPNDCTTPCFAEQESHSFDKAKTKRPDPNLRSKIYFVTAPFLTGLQRMQMSDGHIDWIGHSNPHGH